MNKPKAIYTTENCTFAYQLRWAVTIFLRAPLHENLWLGAFQESLEVDELRVLSWRWLNSDAVQLAVSAKPSHSPIWLIQRMKGRMQYAMREHEPKALRPHYAIRSFGTQEREVIEAYIAKQPQHHPMAAEHSQQVLNELMYVDPLMDLTIKQTTNHGDYWYNLHLVLVNEGRWRNVDRDKLAEVRNMTVMWASTKKLRLSRCALLADHMHLAVGCHMELAPEEIVLSLMNNVAWVYGMRPVLSFSAFVGTFGEYDQRAIMGEPSL